MLVPKKARRKHHIPWSHQVDAVNLRPVSARVPVLLDTELSLQPVFFLGAPWDSAPGFGHDRQALSAERHSQPLMYFLQSACIFGVFYM